MRSLVRGRGRGRAAVFAGTLFAFQALALIGAQTASAVVTCSFTAPTMSITASANLDAVTVQQQSSTQIFVNGAACGIALTSNTTGINITGGAGDQTVTIDLFDETGATIDWGTINWTVNLGADGAAGDSFVITDATGDSAVDVVGGASGWDLNNDGDLDVTETGVELHTLTGTTAAGTDDSLSGAGSTATGAAFADDLTITDAAGDNTLTGGAGNDTITGGGDDDTLAGGAGDDTLTGGAGTDAVDYSGSTAAVNVNLGTGTATGQGLDTLVTVEDIIGSPQGDTLTGDGAANVITPGAGDDNVTGAAGVDGVDYSDATAAVEVDLDAGTATGGSGNDTLATIEDVQGSDFNDTISGDAGDNGLFGGSGNDVLAGGDGADVLDGEGGIDTADYSASTDDLTVSLNGGADDGAAGEGDNVLTENVNLGSGDDTFTGNAFSNRVQPGGGQNVLDGEGGGDTLDYSAGYDAGVNINLAGGGVSTDAISDFENAIGTKFADSITGEGGSNSLKGRGGNDSVKGGAGDDSLYGGRGNDALRGGSGDDDLFGGKGKHDAAYGGTGVDLCKGAEIRKGCEIH